VEAAKSLIDNAALVPAWEAQFQRDATARTVHHGTHLEGNDLSLTQAKKVIAQVEEDEEKTSKKGKKVAQKKPAADAEKVADKAGVVGRERDIQEVINYRNVLKYIDELAKPQRAITRKTPRIWINRRGMNHRKMPALPTPQFPEENLPQIGTMAYYSEAELLTIHRLTVERILTQERAGQYRTTRVVIKETDSGKVTYRPPLPVEVKYQVEEFFEWLNSLTAKDDHPVIRAGIAHYELVRIHPFVDGNGRVARAMATLILFREGYDIKRFFSLEEYYDQDPIGYYGALQSVLKQNGDLTTWLEYFTLGLAAELEKVREKVQKMSLDVHLRSKTGKQISVSERQIKLIEQLKELGELGVPDARRVLPMVSDDTILRDFNDLIKKGIVKKKGQTKGARYTLR
jgi:Fic family protein